MRNLYIPVLQQQAIRLQKLSFEDLCAAVLITQQRLTEELQEAKNKDEIRFSFSQWIKQITLCHIIQNPKFNTNVLSNPNIHMLAETLSLAMEKLDQLLTGLTRDNVFEIEAELKLFYMKILQNFGIIDGDTEVCETKKTSKKRKKKKKSKDNSVMLHLAAFFGCHYLRDYNKKEQQLLINHSGVLYTFCILPGKERCPLVVLCHTKTGFPRPIDIGFQPRLHLSNIGLAQFIHKDFNTYIEENMPFQCEAKPEPKLSSSSKLLVKNPSPPEAKNDSASSTLSMVYAKTS
jgi:hypothetical protein